MPEKLFYETIGGPGPLDDETMARIKRLEEESKKRPKEGIDHFKDRPIDFEKPEPKIIRRRRRKADGKELGFARKVELGEMRRAGVDDSREIAGGILGA